MATKRMIEANIFGSPILRGLKGSYKLLFLYVYTECDHAGIYNVELDIAQVRCGYEYDLELCLQHFGSLVVPVDGGNKWFLPYFFHQQYKKKGDDQSMSVLPELNPKNQFHAGAIKRLSEFGLDDYIRIKNSTNDEEHQSLINGASVGVKDIHKDIHKNIVEVGGVGEGEVAEILKLELQPHSQLNLDACRLAFLHHPFCDESRKLVEEQFYRRVDGLQNQNPPHLFELVKDWSEVFNKTLIKRTIRSRSIGEWCSHFSNWLNTVDLKQQPKQFFNNSQNKIANGSHSTQSNVGGQTSGTTVIPENRNYTRSQPGD